MSQLGALVWLKWTLFRNSLRSRKAVVGRLASALGLLAGLALALVVALGLGTAAYFFSLPARPDVTESRVAHDGFVFLFFVFTVAFLMWGLMPLALGGGSRFEPGRMLLYPISLRKLFVFDFVSDLSSLSAVFAVPVVLAIGLGAGLGWGKTGRGLLVSLVAIVFGMAFAKVLAVGMGALMRQRRTRGETLAALLGAVLGLTGAFLGQLMPLMERYAPYLEGARWTPPGAAASALTQGLRPGGAPAYAATLAALAGYAVAFTLLAYFVARRTALGLGGGGRKRAASASSKQAEGRVEGYAGWQLPLMSPQLAAVVEKELRYAVRNAQLRVIALMAVGLTVVIRMAPLGPGAGGGWGGLTPYAEGAGAVFSVLYIITLVSPVSTNLFGYEGAGMRALVLSPMSRRTLLVGKNLAVTLVTTALVAGGVVAGGLIFRDLSARVVLFVVLAFATFAPLFALFGNWLSLRFPKRVEFGKRMNRSGVAGFLLIPIFLLLLLPPTAAVVAAHFAQSHLVKYVILAAFAALSVSLYLLLVPGQARSLARRELDILEAVTGRGGDEDTRIMG